MKPVSGRVGVLVKTFPKLSETFILGEVLGLERAGFEVVVFTLQTRAEPLTQPAAAEVRADIVPLESALPGALGDLERTLALAGHLRRRGLRHLHAHFVDGTADIAARAARIAGATHSISAHAKDIYLSRDADVARRMGRAEFTVTCTGFNHSYLMALAPEPSRVHRVYHGIDTRHFSPASGATPLAGGPLRILAVGRLRRKKGFARLVRACGVLATRGIAFDCEIVGYGEEQAALEASIAALGLRGLVRLTGRATHAELVGRYRAANVFVAPSEITEDGDRDGIPNVLLEAMACGLPVVSTPVSGIPEVVEHGVNGVLVTPGDFAPLADALATLAADVVLRASLGAAARETVVKTFGDDGSLTVLANLLGPLVEECAPSTPVSLQLTGGAYGRS